MLTKLDELLKICEAVAKEPWIASPCEDPRILKIISAAEPAEICEISAVDCHTKTFLLTARTEFPKVIKALKVALKGLPYWSEELRKIDTILRGEEETK